MYFHPPYNNFYIRPWNLSRVVSVHDSSHDKIQREIFLLFAQMHFNAMRYMTSNIKVNGCPSPDELPTTLPLVPPIPKNVLAQSPPSFPEDPIPGSPCGEEQVVPFLHCRTWSGAFVLPDSASAYFCNVSLFPTVKQAASLNRQIVRWCFPPQRYHGIIGSSYQEFSCMAWVPMVHNCCATVTCRSIALC